MMLRVIVVMLRKILRDIDGAFACCGEDSCVMRKILFVLPRAFLHDIDGVFAHDRVIRVLSRRVLCEYNDEMKCYNSKLEIYYSLMILRISSSAASISSRNSLAETRIAPLPMMISCSIPSEVTTRTRLFFASL